MISLSLSNFVRPFLQGNQSVVLMPPGPDQPFYLVWKASKEAQLVKPLVRAHQVVSAAP